MPSRSATSKLVTITYVKHDLFSELLLESRATHTAVRRLRVEVPNLANNMEENIGTIQFENII